MATTKEEPPRDVKLAVLGINGVGKSSLVIQFVHGHFILEYDPTIEDSYRKIVKLPDFMNQVSDKSPQILIDLLDTAAEEVGMRDRYVRTAQGFAMVYSVTSKKSFEALEPFVQNTYKEKDMLDGTVPFVLMANKIDLESERQVSAAAGREYAAKHNMSYVETSAKTRTNVDEAFIDLAKKVLEAQRNGVVFNGVNKRIAKKYKIPLPGPVTFSDKFTKVPSVRLRDEELDYQKPPPTFFVGESGYLKDMKALQQDTEYADVCFTSIDTQTIRAHKFVVIARCSKLRQLIEEQEKSADKQAGIPVPFKASTIQLFLDFAYTNSVEIKEGQDEIPDLLALAKQWEMPDLVSCIAQKYPSSVERSEIPTEVDTHTIPKFKRDMRRSLIASGSDYRSFDVQFNIKDEPGKFIPAHKAILVHRSPYFRAMFTGGTKEKNEFEIEMSDFGHLILLTAIEYCYTDDIQYLDEKIAVDLLIAANKLCLGRLKSKVAEYLATEMGWDNLIEMFRLATVADAQDLRDFCSYYIIRVLNILSQSHKDFKILTQEEIAFFEERRRGWPDIPDIEKYWISKLTGEEEQEEALNTNTPTNSKKCIVM